MSAATCPACAKAMTTVEADGIAFDRCGACGGLWFDRLEHDALKALGSTQVEREPKPPVPVPTSIRRCPRCKVAMATLADRLDRHLLYEKCSACGGVFFDAGEFKRYAGAGSHLSRFLKRLF